MCVDAHIFFHRIQLNRIYFPFSDPHLKPPYQWYRERPAVMGASIAACTLLPARLGCNWWQTAWNTGIRTFLWMLAQLVNTKTNNCINVQKKSVFVYRFLSECLISFELPICFQNFDVNNKIHPLKKINIIIISVNILCCKTVKCHFATI